MGWKQAFDLKVKSFTCDHVVRREMKYSGKDQLPKTNTNERLVKCKGSV